MEIQLNFIVKLLILCESICRRQIDFTAGQATFCRRQRRPSNFLPQAAQAKRPRHPPFYKANDETYSLDKLANSHYSRVA